MKNTEVSLKEFVSKVIEDVYNGVAEGKERIEAPKPYMGVETTHIEFDLAVTSTDISKKGTSGGIGIGVLKVFNIGAKGKSSSATTLAQQNRIRFSIPLFLRVEERTKK